MIKKTVFSLCLLVLLFGISSCRLPIPNPIPIPDELGKLKLEEMRQLAVEIPVHPSFKKVDEYSGAKPDQASMGWNYKSTAKYEDVKQYYVEHLAKSSWNLISEENMTDWFSEDGARKITFQKQDIILTIQYAGASSNYGWDYALDLHFGY